MGSGSSKSFCDKPFALFSSRCCSAMSASRQSSHRVALCPRSSLHAATWLRMWDWISLRWSMKFAKRVIE